MIVVKQIADLPYVTALGLPIKWQDEQSDILSAAIKAYIDHKVDPAQAPEPTPQQLGFIVDYFNYFINAPCWDSAESFTEELAGLRDRIKALKEAERVTVDDIAAWIRQAMEIALDPL